MKALQYGQISGATDVPETVVVAWGARAIKEGESFCLLGSRQSIIFNVHRDSKVAKAFETWLDNVALRQCRKWAHTVRDDSYDVFELKSPVGFKFTATCNGSFDYIYMTAWAESK